jgi:hypothetical protein
MTSAVTMQPNAEGRTTGSPRRYRLINTDAHINEPPDL